MSSVHGAGLRLLALLILPALLSCASGTSGGDVQTQPEAETVSAHMLMHFARAGQIQSALIMGDLEGARRPARWLAQHHIVEGLPAGTESFGNVMQSIASEIAESQTIESAAKSASRMARTCGNCHSANQAGPSFILTSRAPEAPDLPGHMLLHLWAVDRMWEGMIGPSDDYWISGARALAETDALDNKDFPISSAATENLARRVHSLAGEGVVTSEQMRRGEIYSDIISSCASCHQMLGVRSG